MYLTITHSEFSFAMLGLRVMMDILFPGSRRISVRESILPLPSAGLGKRSVYLRERIAVDRCQDIQDSDVILIPPCHADYYSADRERVHRLELIYQEADKLSCANRKPVLLHGATQDILDYRLQANIPIRDFLSKHKYSRPFRACSINGACPTYSRLCIPLPISVRTRGTSSILAAHSWFLWGRRSPWAAPLERQPGFLTGYASAPLI